MVSGFRGDELKFGARLLELRGKGLNFGWNVMEGLHCYNATTCNQAGKTLPVIEYSHAGGACSVTGGYVYRGTAFPTMQGVYFYADECTGRVWSLSRDNAGNWSSNELLNSGITISSFGEDQNGEVYVTGLSDGTVYHLVTE